MALAQLRQHLQTVQARQENIHQHHVERLARGDVQAFLTVLAPGHLKAAAAQMFVNIGAEYRIVFDGENAWLASGNRSHEYLQVILS
ncbi:hypothetical protein D3C81_1268660 [compost metagenome]